MRCIFELCAPLPKSLPAEGRALGHHRRQSWRARKGGVPPLAGAGLYMRARRYRRCTHARARETGNKTHHGPPVAPPDRAWCVLFRVSLAHVAMYQRCRGLRGRATDRKSAILVVPGGGGSSSILAISGAQSLAPRELSPSGPLLEEKYFLTEWRCRREDRAQKGIRTNFFLRSAAFRGHSQLTRGQPPGDSCSTKSTSRRQV